MLETIAVTNDTLRAEAQKLFDGGWRLVTYTATKCPPSVEGGDSYIDLLFHFDKDLELRHLRMSVPEKGTVTSLSPIYLAAVLIENELRDLFGLTFEGLVLDYSGTLYLEGDVNRAPFCSFTTVRKEKG